MSSGGREHASLTLDTQAQAQASKHSNGAETRRDSLPKHTAHHYWPCAAASAWISKVHRSEACRHLHGRASISAFVAKMESAHCSASNGGRISTATTPNCRGRVRSPNFQHNGSHSGTARLVSASCPVQPSRRLPRKQFAFLDSTPTFPHKGMLPSPQIHSRCLPSGVSSNPSRFSRES